MIVKIIHKVTREERTFTSINKACDALKTSRYLLMKDYDIQRVLPSGFWEDVPLDVLKRYAIRKKKEKEEGKQQ
jgi:hypothetical protein